MPFKDILEVQQRLLRDPTPLSELELRDVQRWSSSLPDSVRTALETQLALMQLAALKQQETLIERQIESFDKFDRSTERANKLMIRFTAAVTAMTVLLLFIALFGSPWV